MSAITRKAETRGNGDLSITLKMPLAVGPVVGRVSGDFPSKNPSDASLSSADEQTKRFLPVFLARTSKPSVFCQSFWHGLANQAFFASLSGANEQTKRFLPVFLARTSKQSVFCQSCWRGRANQAFFANPSGADEQTKRWMPPPQSKKPGLACGGPIW